MSGPDEELRDRGQQHAPGTDVLDSLERDDRFRVESHDTLLRVHRAGRFTGDVVLVAYDESGAKWTVFREAGETHMGRMESRRKSISSVEVIGE